MVKFMKFRDLRNTPSAVWRALSESEAVAIVSNGEPRALMLEIEGGDLEGTLELVRRVRAQIALSRIQAAAVRRGVDRISDEGVEDEIRAARSDRRAASRARGRGKRAQQR